SLGGETQMHGFRKQCEKLSGRFEDRSGAEPKDENRYWPPIVVTAEEIEREVERLADLPRPANGRRESLIVHPYAEVNSPAMTPGTQTKLAVHKPSATSAPFRHHHTEV